MFNSTRDNLIALLVLVISGGLFFQSYASLLSQIEARGLLFSDIKLGSNDYFIENAENCVGSFKVTSEEGNLLKVLLELKLKVLLDQDPEDFALSIESYFNPLGQLIGAQAKIDFHDDTMFIRAQGVNPISLRATGQFDGLNIEQTLEVPGPLEIRAKNDEQSYQILYPHARSLVSKFPLPESSSLKILNLQIKEKPSCTADKPYDMRGLLAMAKTMNLNIPETIWSK